MNMRKVIAAFLALICMCTAAAICGTAATAATTDTVYAQTSSSLRQGDYGYCYVYLDDLTDLSALTVTVHYDSDKVNLVSSYNQVNCLLYDSAVQPGSVQYTYIFSGDGPKQKTGLFYFQYQIKADAPIGESYFDIVISDAFNTSLESLPIGGSRCSFSITEKQTSKQCTIYGPSSISTSVTEEFTLTYTVSNYQIASGALSIHYDPELFEFEDLTLGGMLDNKVVDVNTSLPGTVYISFVGTSYSVNSNLLQIRFRTIRNEDVTSQISLSATDLYDQNLQSIQCAGYVTTVQMTYDNSYTMDAPGMRLSAVYNEESRKVVLTVLLDADSQLGAGDFVLKFDTDCLTYGAAEKGFTPNFFIINDKNVAAGELKFSIVSLEEINDPQTVLIVEFDAVRCAKDTNTVIEITGSGITDSMTTPIVLNLAGCNVTILRSIIYGDANEDGIVNLLDVMQLRKYLVNIDPNTGISSLEIGAGADANGDGIVNVLDVMLLRRYLVNIDHNTGESSIVLGPQS